MMHSNITAKKVIVRKYDGDEIQRYIFSEYKDHMSWVFEIKYRGEVTYVSFCDTSESRV